MPYRILVWLERDGKKWEELKELVTYSDDEREAHKLLREFLEDFLIEICPDEGDGEVLQNVLEGDRVIGWSVPSELDNIPFLYHFKIRCLGCYPDMPENAKLVAINWSMALLHNSQRKDKISVRR